MPTIGRPKSLERLLESLVGQTLPVDEVIVADGSGSVETRDLISQPRWASAGLRVRWLTVTPPSAVRQRIAAIAQARGSLLLLLDDDVVLEPDCVQEMVALIGGSDDIVAVFADITNIRWPGPTKAWRFVLRHGMGIRGRDWQGRVIGPLLRFGFDPVPPAPRVVDWIGAGSSLVRLSAYHRSGGFSTFFLDRSSIHEDVDLALRLKKIGQILFCPYARLAHYQDHGGRVSVSDAAEDDLHNRFWVLHKTRGLSLLKALSWVIAFFVIETAANLASAASGRPPRGDWARFRGRSRALGRVLWSLTIGTRPS